MSVSGAGIVQVGLDHRDVGAEAFERLLASGWCSGRPDLPVGAGMVALATCHRRELYLEGVDPARALALFGEWAGAVALPEIPPRIRVDVEAGRHLLRVTAGLESAVLGEDQILGQAREAYRRACAGRRAGPVLHRLFHAAFRAGKRVRTETDLGRGGRSLAGVAVSWLASVMGGLKGRRVLVLGAGEMAAVAAQRLVKRGAGELVVANRTLERARELVRRVGGRAVPWSWWPGMLAEMDGLVCTTGAPEPVVRREHLGPAVGRLAVVDLAVPRNVEVPEERDRGVVVAGMSELVGRLAGEERARSASVKAAERIVEEELETWTGWLHARGEGAVRRGTGGRRVVSAG